MIETYRARQIRGNGIIRTFRRQKPAVSTSELDPGALFFVLGRLHQGTCCDDVECSTGAHNMLTRRHFIQTTTALFSASVSSPLFAESWPTVSQKAAWDAQVTPPGYNAATSNPWGLHPRFLPQRVQANEGLVPGDIHVDAVAKYLYHIEAGGTAMRYGVAIGRGDLYEPGVYTIKRKVEWPHWTPTQSMIAREPEIYAQFEGGVEPGPENALGSRALYLFVGERDTYLRIHGTPFPRSIGTSASSGCVRMVMAHINDLYSNVEISSTAFLYSAAESVAARS